VRTIGDALIDKGVSWPTTAINGTPISKIHISCNITAAGRILQHLQFEQYATSIMTNPAVRTAHLKDTADLYAGIKSGQLPAVSYVKPSGWVDGHPASSKLDLFEGFVKEIVDGVKANPKLWADTAILVTFDEGGGYWDSAMCNRSTSSETEPAFP